MPGLARHTAASLLHGTLREGPARARFEAALSERLRGARVEAVGSGRLALLLVLEALEVPRGAIVLLPSYNASCVPNVLQAAGYGLHFVDVRPDTLHLDPALLPDPPPEGAGAVVVTHVEGSPADLGPVLAWARRHGLAVVEDAAHALGATFRGEPVGTLADGAIFSLGRGKHLNTLGGGLAVVQARRPAERLASLAARLPAPPPAALLSDVVMEGVVETGTAPALFGALAWPAMRLARRFGRDPMTALFEDAKGPLAAVPASMKRRLSNLQARFGLEALLEYDASLARRRAHAGALRDGLAGVVPLQEPLPGADPAWLEMTALVPDRAEFQARLLAKGIDTQRTWMDACDALPAFASAGGGPCPVARDVAARAVYLPTYASLEERQVAAVVRRVREVVADLAREPREAAS